MADDGDGGWWEDPEGLELPEPYKSIGACAARASSTRLGIAVAHSVCLHCVECVCVRRWPCVWRLGWTVRDRRRRRPEHPRSLSHRARIENVPSRTARSDTALHHALHHSLHATPTTHRVPQDDLLWNIFDRSWDLIERRRELLSNVTRV
jgi:hypothetical protein